jgi:hypothetical protein
MVQVFNVSSSYTESIPESAGRPAVAIPANKRPGCSREGGSGMADLSDAVVVVRAERGIGGMIARIQVVFRGPCTVLTWTLRDATVNGRGKTPRLDST